MSNLTEEDKKKIERIVDELKNEPYCGRIKSRRSGCMLVLIIPLIVSATVCLIIFS